MSTKAQELARQLQEKTLDGKLKWVFVPDPDEEIYKAIAEEGISFSIKRKATGDNKTVTFQLTEPGRVVLSDTESNFPISPVLRSSFAPTITINGMDLDTHEKIDRFRLYSDLFYAARETAEGGDQAIEKAQRFLARLA